MEIGDRDRAVHVTRTSLLDEGDADRRARTLAEPSVANVTMVSNMASGSHAARPMHNTSLGRSAGGATGRSC